MKVSELIAEQNKAANGNVNKDIWGDLIFNVKVYGAKGDGATDDAAAINAAINAASAAGGGLVVFPPGTYRVTSQLILKSNIVLQGSPGAVLYMDFTDTKGVSATGTTGTAISVTADINPGGLTITVGSTTGLSVGDLIEIADVHPNNTKYPRSYGIIKSLTSTVVTLQSAMNLSYKVANTSTITKITPVVNVGIDGLTVKCSDTSAVLYLLSFYYCKEAFIRNVTILNHRHATNPGGVISIQMNNCYNIDCSGNTKYAIADKTLDNANMINIGFGEKSTVMKNRGFGIIDGVVIGFSQNSVVSHNLLQGYQQSGSRGIKISGCYYVICTDNIIKSTDSGIKCEDSSKYIIKANQILDSGMDIAGSTGINISSQFNGNGEYIHGICEGNYVKNQTGHGINSDIFSTDMQIMNNIIEACSGVGIICTSVNSQICGNRVLESGNQGIQFVPKNSIVKNNYVHITTAATKSFKLLDTVGLDNCIFTDNMAPNNGLDSTVADFRLIGVCGNNIISGANTPYPKNVNRGKASIAINAAAFGSIAITYANPYPTGKIPRVLATCDQGAYYAVATSETETGFTLLANHRDGTAATITVGVFWAAIDP